MIKLFTRIFDKLFPPTFVYSKPGLPLDSTGNVKRHAGRLVFGVVIPTRDIGRTILNKLQVPVYLGLWEVIFYGVLGIALSCWLWSTYTFLFRA